jgi:hypothetical protein
MVSRPRLSLKIGGTWDDRPLRDDEGTAVSLSVCADHLLAFVDAAFHGDPPPLAPPGSTPGLWEHEVVEVFVAGEGPPEAVEYTELELAPGGHYLVLRFRGVRQRLAAGLPLDYRAAVADGRWRGVARLPLSTLPPPPWRIAAFALHGAGPDRRHLASVPLPGPRPDFHQPHRFPRLAVPHAAVEQDGSRR